MAKDFSFNLNKKLLNSDINVEAPTDEETNRIEDIADEIIKIFAKYNLSYEDAYILLGSLADAIYLYSVTVE